LVGEEVGFMNKEGYEYLREGEVFYTFLSIGKKEIPKIVYFQEIESKMYNLVLTDVDFQTNSLSDTATSNNGDLPKIMATVVHILFAFLNSTPDACVILEGNTTSKQKLYNRLVSNNYEELNDLIDIKIPSKKGLVYYQIGDKANTFYIYQK
jgi:hypothetical protein